MTTILDLPLHPLVVHAPIILVGLLVLGGIAYLLIPPLRRRIGWAVAALVLVAPASVFGGILTGRQFADYKKPEGWSEPIAQHHDYAFWLLWTLVALIPVWFLFAGLDRGRRASRAREGAAPAAAEDGEAAPAGSSDPAATGRKVVMFIVGLAALALLLLAAWWLFKTGHSGADMTWGGIVR